MAAWSSFVTECILHYNRKATTAKDIAKLRTKIETHVLSHTNNSKAAITAFRKGIITSPPPPPTKKQPVKRPRTTPPASNNGDDDDDDADVDFDRLSDVDDVGSDTGDDDDDDNTANGESISADDSDRMGAECVQKQNTRRARPALFDFVSDSFGVSEDDVRDTRIQMAQRMISSNKDTLREVEEELTVATGRRQLALCVHRDRLRIQIPERIKELARM
jgi:hypothetical protein